MKWQQIIFLLVFAMLSAIMHSCQKELYCESCVDNLLPIANAGNDSSIILPADSAILNGSASIDPDGTLTNFQWTKIYGPATITISNSSAQKTVVKNLKLGTYLFELSVTDNGGLIAKDTVQIIVDDLTRAPNRPPVANAGKDETIILHSDIVSLDGTLSTDPDNNITGFIWTKISGPLSFSIEQPNAANTAVINVVQGVYLFELKVTDDGGLFSKDTVKITINAPVVIPPCGNQGKQVNAQLKPAGTLSQARTGMAIAAAGNKILFAGGMIRTGLFSSTVDIYNISNNTWSVAQLSVARGGIATVVSGNKIFFAGGTTGNDFAYNTVDIYDASIDTWSTAELSQEGWGVAVATVGDKVFFAGGDAGDNYTTFERRVIDIYDMVSDTWDTHMLSERKENLSAVTVNNKIYFAGGAHWTNNNQPMYTSLNTIEIYDNASGTWSISTMQEAKFNHAGISYDNKVYWAGGMTGNINLNVSCIVEIRDAITEKSTIQSLSRRWKYPVSAAVLQDTKLLFFGGDEYMIEVYDISTNTWSVGVLPQNIMGASVYSFDNTVYLAGMGANGVFSTQVWKLEF